MTEQPDSEQVLHRLFEQITQHIETRWEYFTLRSTEKISGMAASLVGAITVIVFAVLVLFFLSMGFAWWLGDTIGNRAGGFALAGMIFVPLAIVANRLVRPFVRDKIIQSVLNEADKENTANDE